MLDTGWTGYSIDFYGFKDRAQRFHFSKFCGLLVLKSIKRSVINIRRSMLDVQSVRCSGLA
jgi:hypothetical protein